MRISGLSRLDFFLDSMAYISSCVGFSVSKSMSFDTNIESVLIDNDFVEACFDESTGDNLDLLPSLDQEVSATWRKPDWNTLSSVPGPYIQSGVARTSVYSEKVEIGMESGKYGTGRKSNCGDTKLNNTIHTFSGHTSSDLTQ